MARTIDTRPAPPQRAWLLLVWLVGFACIAALWMGCSPRSSRPAYSGAGSGSDARSVRALGAPRRRSGHPVIQSAPDFGDEQLLGQRVLILPLATTSELGDERTGIVLAQRSVREAGVSACEELREELQDVQIVCFYDASLRSARPLLQQLLLSFARDEAIAPETYKTLAERTGAAFVLLFRPEGVKAKRAPGSPGAGSTPYVHVPPTHSPGLSPAANAAATAAGSMLGHLVAAALMGHGGPEGERTYTVSAALTDARTGHTRRVGVGARKGSQKGGALPDPAPILADLMVSLSESMIPD